MSQRGTRRRAVSGVIAAVAALALTGCGGVATSPSAPTIATASPAAASATATAATAAPSASASVARPAPSASASASEPSPSAATLPEAWTALDAPGPPAREDHTLTVAPDGTAWLFGGRNNATVHGDLWQLDLATDAWTEVEVDGASPDARFGHTGTWVDGVGLVVWSGQAGSTFFDDLWAWDPEVATWRELAAAGERPAARYGSCAAMGPDGRLWVSHGFTSDFGRFDDTWAYDFASGAWSDETSDGQPFVRCLHDCLVTPDGRFVVYAGQTTGAPAIGDLWTRDAAGAWTQAPTPEPAPRQLYALAVRDEAAWIFGGGGNEGSKLRDLWRLDLATLEWREVAVAGGPGGRSGAALVWDADRDRLVLVGGLTAEGVTAETWSLDFGL